MFFRFPLARPVIPDFCWFLRGSDYFIWNGAWLDHGTPVGGLFAPFGAMIEIMERRSDDWFPPFRAMIEIMERLSEDCLRLSGP
ncbi:hypothetical protein J6524_01540 [Bradyrhizobium sp. WSM 1738]|uniref:hypothetical protein n=1 Tax=Bradyrhizobium hereditatis TaxID=2821405 RepID=UPI001CE2340A|nr:hypothetical protein [Bradyrhizobium hereditatis]MCA6113615.1 hypothetical protein [Bradyrhizobium hereditatis]